ncbi:MAG: hypothetical protein KJ587_02655 [Alphaproteobacteria bacterium]|nr:hypothetical protein [Alphaproteobacteria bacterium]
MLDGTPELDVMYQRIFDGLGMQLVDTGKVIGELENQCRDLGGDEPILPFVSMGLQRLHEATRMHGWNGGDQQVLDRCAPATAIQSVNAAQEAVDIRELSPNLGDGRAGQAAAVSG